MVKSKRMKKQFEGTGIEYIADNLYTKLNIETERDLEDEEEEERER